MRKKLALLAVAVAGAVAFMIPSSASAADPACVVVDAPPLHLQIGYAPTGPDGCVHLP